MKAPNRHTQGSVDGLCGIYSLVHYFDNLPRVSVKSDEKPSKSAFRALLQSAERLKVKGQKQTLLSAANICDGYFTDDLVRIFNETARRKRLPHQAADFWKVFDPKDSRNFGELLRLALTNGASVVLQVYGTKHFVLAFALDEDGDFLVKDSGHIEKFRLSELKRAPRSDDCVVLAPTNSLVFEKRL